jgi:hypothetical protein
MKTTTLLLLPAVASAAILQSRQIPYKSIGAAKLERTINLAPEVRPDAIHQITRFGPYKLRAVRIILIIPE